MTQNTKSILLGLVLVWLVFVGGQLSKCFDLNSDSVHYLRVAESISQGEGYTYEGEFMRKFPPVLSVLLSPVSSPDDGNYRPEKIILALFALGALIGSFLCLRLRCSWKPLFVLSILVAVHPTLLHYTPRIRADIPFFCFSVFLFYCCDRYWNTERVHPWLAVGLALLFPLATLTRSAGLAFYIAAFLYVLRPRIWREKKRHCVWFLILILFVSVPPVAAWMYSTNVIYADSQIPTYFDSFKRVILEGHSLLSKEGLLLFAEKELRAVVKQVSSMGWAIVGTGGDSVGIVAAVLFLPFVGLSLWKRRQEPCFSDLAFVVYTLMILFWPWSQKHRFWLPVLPLIFWYLGKGIRIAKQSLGEYIRDHGPPVFSRETWKTFFRYSIVYTGAGILMVHGFLYGSKAIVDGYLQCRNSIGGVYVTGTVREVATFLRHKQKEGKRIFCLHDRAPEISLAVQPLGMQSQVERYKSLTGGERISKEPASFIREMYQNDVTHLAFEMEEPEQPHEYNLRELRLYLEAHSEQYPRVRKGESMSDTVIYQLRDAPKGK